MAGDISGLTMEISVAELQIIARVTEEDLTVAEILLAEGVKIVLIHPGLFKTHGFKLASVSILMNANNVGCL
jgi:hypothetical protein